VWTQSAWPNTNARELDEGEIFDCELVVAGGDVTTLLDFVEEPLDEAARSVEIKIKADQFFASARANSLSQQESECQEFGRRRTVWASVAWSDVFDRAPENGNRSRVDDMFFACRNARHCLSARRRVVSRAG
jgi:hypothetical protein